MAKVVIPFADFTAAAGLEHKEFVDQMHNFMLAHDSFCEIKEAKSGYVVSYIYKPEKRTIFNYVFRKKGMLMRVYAENVANYVKILDNWPQEMKKIVKKAGPCKRMLDPNACSSRCRMGFDFMLNSERQQKCRYSSFFFLLDDQSKPYMREMVEREMQMREARSE